VSTRDERETSASGAMVFIEFLADQDEFFFFGLAAHPTVFLWADLDNWTCMMSGLARRLRPGSMGTLGR